MENEKESIPQASTKNTKLSVKTATVIFIIIACCAFLLYLTLGAFLNQELDLLRFNLPWAVSGAKDGLFSIYLLEEPAVDYPPVFPTLLSLFGEPLIYFYSIGIWPIVMLLLKFWPILFFVLLAVVIFFFLRKESLILAILGGTLWLVNPTAVVNCVWWGQADCLFCFFLFLTFWFLYKRRPELALAFFALGCLTKLQMCYFAPIILCELFFYYPIKRTLRSLFLGIGIGVLSWVPFMIGARSLSLPFKIYFDGLGKYPYTQLNAANLYGVIAGPYLDSDSPALGGFSFPSSELKMFGDISYSQFSAFMLFFIIAAVIIWYIFAKVMNVRLEAAVIAAIYSNFIFIFTISQHERYQIPVMLLVFLWYLIYKEMPALILYIFITIITFFNQLTVLIIFNFEGVFDFLLVPSLYILGVCNIIVFIFMIVFTVCKVFRQIRGINRLKNNENKMKKEIVKNGI